MPEIAVAQDRSNQRREKVLITGLRALGVSIIALGMGNAVDEAIDYVRASQRVEGPCVLTPHSEACDALVEAEHDDSIAEGIGSLVGGGGLGGLVLYMAYGIANPVEEREE